MTQLKSKKKAKTIHLIRHGQASAGTADYDRLSPIGEQQATVLGNHLQETPMAMGSIWSGSLKRQHQTALIAHPDIAHPDASGISAANGILQIHPDLNEYDHRQIHRQYHPERSKTDYDDTTDLPAGMTFEIYTGIIHNWASDSDKPRTAGTESWEQFNRRTLAAVTDVAERSPDDHLLLYSSGGVISVVVAQLMQLDVAEIPILIWQMNNASITRVSYQDGKLNLLSVNGIDHFDAHHDQGLVTWI